MSDAVPPREWRFYVEDMLACCDKVLAYTKGVDRAGFSGDSMRYDATLRNLELIGARPQRTCRSRFAQRRLMYRGAWWLRCATG
jgi:uncharacterized protein with HEPN domain